ncbi:50S ribosomal protein L23 [Methanosarcina sp.]|jgi:large subunit ribosomal protein L23|uniref:50S ribosomal protein L23 n=1 Tax=Methanosarcina sp. TaxID=2213 RepID=UPI003BB73DF3
MSSINYPFVTEKAMMLLEENKLQFIVDTRSNKKQIVEDVEKLYGFKVTSVRTMTTMKGTKKAILTFAEPESAHEIATRIGLM